MSDDNLVALLDDADKHRSGFANPLHLLLGVVSEGVAPEGDNDAILLPFFVLHDFSSDTLTRHLKRETLFVER